MKTYARRDEAFNEFMKQFKRKQEPKWANVFDFTEGSKEDILLNKSPDFRVNELKMLEEFRRRKKIKSYYKAVSESEKKHNYYEETEPVKEAQLHQEMTKKERYLKLVENYDTKKGMEYFMPQQGDLFNPSDFTIMFMDSDAITKITALNRINRRRVLLFCGNHDGVISYGKGRGVDYEDAFQSAIRDLKENMIAIDLDHLNTLPKPIRGRYNDFKLELRPRDPPNHWGGGQLWVMFKMVGIFHHDWTCNVRKRKPYPLIYSFFNLVSQNTTVKRLAEMHGKKHYQLYYGRPSRHNVPRGMRF